MHDLDDLDQDEPLDSDDELRAAYPFLYDDADVDEDDKDTLGSSGLNAVAPTREPDYHNLSELSDELLPRLNFWRLDNLFSARPASAFLSSENDAETATSSPCLFGNYWHEGEIAILFSDTGAGKSILAVQIAQSIASGSPWAPFSLAAPPRRVLYFDLELTTEQFRRRYSLDDPSCLASFPFDKRLIRAVPGADEELPPDCPDYTYFLTSSLVELIEFSGARVVIIDNISWLNNASQYGISADRLMKALQRLRRRLGLSILVLAHTPKRRIRSRLTLNDLQGSNMISVFADSVFALGFSQKAPDIRYLKGIKRRNSSGGGIHETVTDLRLAKDVCFLGFVPEGSSDERDHIGWSGSIREAEKLDLMEKAAELHKLSLSQRQIAQKLGVSASTVNRCLKQLEL
jgi:hypothetical protein